MVNPEVARGTLLALAGLQARRRRAVARCGAGKILHELRAGELARTGHIPHTPYYGTVDATPLFLLLAGGYFRWTLDIETTRAAAPGVRCGAWLDRRVGRSRR